MKILVFHYDLFMNIFYAYYILPKNYIYKGFWIQILIFSYIDLFLYFKASKFIPITNVTCNYSKF